MPDTITLDDLNYFQRFNHNFSNYQSDVAGQPSLSNFDFFRIKQISSIPKQDRIPTEYLLCGLHGSNIPVAFLIDKTDGNISVNLGVWKTGNDGVPNGNAVLKSLLKTIYPFIEVSDKAVPLKMLQKTGLVLGLPTAKLLIDEDHPQTSMDRLLQAVNIPANFQCLVLAQSTNEASDNSLLNLLTNELRRVLTFVQDGKVPNPTADHYSKILETAVKNTELGKEIGSWKTAVYLSTDPESFTQLSGVWKAVFSGDESLVQPIRIGEITTGEYRFAETAGKSGTGIFKHPFQYLTIMNSRQLASYIHLPNFETPGIGVIRVPDFDSEPQTPETNQRIELGMIMHNKAETKSPYQIDIGSLVKHCFVAGTTGSGKTNTIFNLLRQANENNVHFLVIESAKAEYRSLRNDQKLSDIQIFTPGNENVSPFRLNPFEVFPDIPVSVHLDLLRSVFIASFGMWTPLPQVLEQCLHRIYEDRGWDLSLNINNRLGEGDDSALAYPTLTDLYNKIEIVTDELGYEEKTSSEIKAALLTRINSLRTGGKGNMLDTRVSIPMNVLLSKSTILELEGIGDDDDKAFIIGLLFIRLVEYRRVQKKEDAHLHLLVIEEAHRLLTNTSSESSEYKGNSKGKAVETFANLLSEIRAYQQGVIIADQIPVKLAPEVIKNSNLKIAHRIISEDDRNVLSGSMALEEEKSIHYSTLSRGEAIVFAERDDAPLIVKVPDKKSDLDAPVTNAAIIDLMKPFQKYAGFKSALIAELDEKPKFNLTDPFAWKIAGKIIGDKNIKKDFVRLIAGATESDQTFDLLWDQLMSRFQFFYDGKTDSSLILNYSIFYLVEWFVEYRGDLYRWNYKDVIDLQKKLYQVCKDKLASVAVARSLHTFRELFYDLHARKFDPFPQCNQVCPSRDGRAPACLYRQPVEDLIKENNETTLLNNWKKIQPPQDSGSIDTAVLVTEGAAGRVLPAMPGNEEGRKRVRGCYALHMFRNESLAYMKNRFANIYTAINK